MVDVRTGWLATGLLGAALLGACAFDWDTYDPRLGSGATGAAAGSGGAGATGGGAGASGGHTPTGGGGAGAVGGGGEGAGGGQGAAGGGGGGGVGACGTVDVLGDDFSDGEEPYDWDGEWDNVDIDEVDGDVVITLPTDQQGGYAELRTSRYYDLRGKRVTIQLRQAPTQQPDTGAFFFVARDPSNGADMWVYDHEIWVEADIGGTHNEFLTVPYDPVDHQWFGLREEGGTFYWETSPDGLTWTALHSRSAALLFPMDSFEVGLGAVDWGTAAPGEARFDNLQGGGPPTEGWCPIDSVSDNFDDGELGHLWEARSDTSSQCSFVKQQGHLVFSHTGAADSSCNAELAPAYDLTGRSVTVEVPTVDLPSGACNVYFGLQYGRVGGWIEIQVEQGNLASVYAEDWDEISVSTIPYDAQAHRWWRIREQAGDIFWQTSPDGIAWDTHGQAQAPWDVTALDLELGLWAGSDCAGPYGAVFDNYNLPP